jgi:hypothetical protein
MMSGFLANMAFLNPWILAGLAFLPALWFLLRVTPPAPRRIKFPATRFLAGLQPDEHTTSRTPWWILLLRILTVALVIIALARPILNPADTLPGDGPVRIVIDNGWASAQTWRRQVDEAAALSARAGREKREIYILTTAPEPGKESPLQSGPLSQGQADGIISGLKPMPWRTDYDKAARSSQENTEGRKITSIWLADGLQDGYPDRLVKALEEQGTLLIKTPAARQRPVLLRPAPEASAELKVRISTPPGMPQGVPLTVQALSADGRVLDSKRQITEESHTVDIAFDLPPTLRQQVSQVRIAGRAGAGAVLLLDDSLSRRTVGIVAVAGADETAPLIDESYYLRRALEPTADLYSGTVDELLEKKPAVLVMPDIGAVPPDELNRIEQWVRRGGLLLRFAGPHMTQGESFLTPVPLMKGGRALDGALTWEKPPRLAPFPTRSPYYGLNIPDDITVSRQILAEPVSGMEELTWAALEDGTPLITAKELDRGMLVLVHTTATPQWSGLALSGLFVQILQRTVSMAGHSASPGTATGALQPLLVLDGFGRAAQPEGFVQPVPADAFDDLIPSSVHPPGLYGRTGYQKALNLGVRLPALQELALPAGTESMNYGGGRETELMPYLLTAAFVLFLTDWLVMILLQAGFYSYYLRRQATAAALAAALIICTTLPTRAEATREMIQYASELHFAYVRTGVADVDFKTQAGLAALAKVLAQRTSVEPEEAVAVDPATDELAFFPLIYWPLTPEQQPLSPQAARNVQSYLDHGGTILFDTRDRQSTPSSFPGSSIGGANAEALRRATAGLNIQPLEPMPEDHVLTKSFYLLHGFPGRYDGGTLWVEESSASGRDGVSSIIIGSHDWAAAWAAADTGRPRLRLGGPQQGEIALRFGVNLVMYALTGNYKADQVHLPHILERLGQ